MKRFSLTILFIFLSFGIAFGGPDTYTVNQNGSGADFSIDQFNDSANWSATDNVSKIDPGDTVYFTGNLTTKIAPPQGYGGSAGGGYVTLDGYQAGSCDHSSGTLDANCINITTSSDYGIELDANTYLNIQDFRITNLTSSGIQSYASDSGETLDHITFSRIGIEVATNGFFITTPGGWPAATNVIIQDSTIKDIAEGDTSSAKAHLRLNKVNNLIIRRNYIFNNAGITLVGNGQDGMVLLDCSYVLIEYNRVHHVSEDCIDYKHTSPAFPSAFGNVIIRFNDLYDSLQSAATVQHEHGSYAYIYANRMHDILGYNPITIQRGFENVYAWSNLIYNSNRACIGMYDQSDYQGTPRPVNNGFFYNNTMVGCGTNADDYDKGALRFLNSEGGDTIAKNNIMVDNNAGGYLTQVLVEPEVVPDATLNYNIYWLSSGTPNIRWNGTTYTLSDPVSGTTWYTASGQGLNSRMVNPALTDLVNRDLRLTSSSTAAINAGEDLSACYPVVIYGTTYTPCLDDAIDPTTVDWTTTPPTVTTVKRDTYGWSIGAYAYGVGAGDTAAPTPNPATFSTSPTADSVSAISMVATTGTDANTISIQFDFDPAADNCGSSPNIGTGGSDRTWTSEDYTHTDDTLQTNQLYCYNVQLRDSIPNTGTVSSTVSVYTLAAVPGASTLSAGSDPSTQFSFDALAENGNPTATPNTEFACQVTTVDEDWNGKWINTTGGVASASEVWSANSVWDALGDVSGANPGTLYNVYCKARNGDNIETALGAVAQITTSGGFVNPPEVVYIGITKSGTNRQ